MTVEFPQLNAEGEGLRAFPSGPGPFFFLFSETDLPTPHCCG